MRGLATYTGIGSRSTPQHIANHFTELSGALALRGFTLRSGGAPGADAAFEAGAQKKEIYLPWRGFNNNVSPLYPPSEAAHAIAKTIHPAWDRLSRGARLLHARNCHQVLGLDLDTPSLFVVCWTADGLPVGGSATAINLANSRGIPVINLGALQGQPTLADTLQAVERALSESQYGGISQ